ncbi:MAG: hypothetical protein E6767_11430 [Dysgonomonas sp.]|nr:hypothetical protein [Dysgonomonas sp.]
MKTTLLATFLLALFILVLPEKAYAQVKGSNYKKFYKELNKSGTQPQIITTKKVANPDEVVDIITVGQLDSVMKNMVGVTDIVQGEKSLLHPVITLELERNSSAAQALFGCDDYYTKDSVGRGEPTPPIPGLETVKRTDLLLAEAKRMQEDAEAKANQPFLHLVSESDVKSTTPVVKQPIVKSEPEPEPENLAVATQMDIMKSEAAKPFRHLLESEQKLLRVVDGVTLTDETDKAYWKKYSLVIGTFKQYSSAYYAKRTFTGLGERSFVLKKSDGTHYVVVGSYDQDSDAVTQLDEFTKKYTTDLSKSRRVARYGLPLDDLWILVH